jgi:uncharacterized protein YutE (UPF0331/DUF86 family)
MALRRVIVHGYEDVDLGIVRDVVVNRLDDFSRFVACIRRKLGEEEGPPAAAEPRSNG